MIAVYTQKPEKVGNYTPTAKLYRWDIHEVENALYGSVFQCNEVAVTLPITPNSIFRAVIHELYPVDQEQKLINEYNAFILGLSGSEEEGKKVVTAYTQFLRERAALKAQIDADCVELNIVEP